MGEKFWDKGNSFVPNILKTFFCQYGQLHNAVSTMVHLDLILKNFQKSSS